MTASDAEALESVLVVAQDCVVADANPDSPEDYDEFSLAGGLRVDDAVFTELDNVYATGTRFASINGLLGFSFGEYKLWPRSAIDLQ
jgi:hypothetical protein